MSLLDRMSGASSVKIVGLAPARITEIVLDDKLTPSGLKRLDFNFQVDYKPKNITQKTKFSVWIKDEIETTKTGKVKFIDERGNFLDSWVNNNLKDLTIVTRLKERQMDINRTRPAYPGEITFINFIRYVIGYNKNSKDTLVNIDGNSGFSIKNIFNKKDELFDTLNEKLSKIDVRVGVMLGLNEQGYSIVYPNQFEYGSVLNKDLSKLSGDKLEKAKSAIEKTQENFYKIKTKYENSVRNALTKAFKADEPNITEALKYHNETDFYYTDLLTEYSDDLLESDLAINYELIRKNVLKEFNVDNLEPYSNSIPF